MEIRLKASAGTPHYLAELCFSRVGDTIVIQIADERNREKARYDVPVLKFNQMADLLLTADPLPPSGEF